MKIAIGADHGGYRLKDVIIPFIESLGHKLMDFGCNCDDSVDYPDYALHGLRESCFGRCR